MKQTKSQTELGTSKLNEQILELRSALNDKTIELQNVSQKFSDESKKLTLKDQELKTSRLLEEELRQKLLKTNIKIADIEQSVILKTQETEQAMKKI